METVKSRFITAKEIAEDCNISISKAYELIREMNKEVEVMGKITLKGKINRHFYEKKINPTDWYSIKK